MSGRRRKGPATVDLVVLWLLALGCTTGLINAISDVSSIGIVCWGVSSVLFTTKWIHAVYVDGYRRGEGEGR